MFFFFTTYNDGKSKSEEENIKKDARNLFSLNRLEKETNDDAIKGIRNFFILEKENKAIKTE